MGLHTNVFTVLRLYGIKWEVLALEHPWNTLFFYKLNAIENFRFTKDHRRKREVRGREGNILQKSVTSLCCELLCSTTWGKPHQSVIVPQRYSISYNTWRQKRRQREWKSKYFFTILSVLVASKMSSLVAKAEDWDHEDFRISRGLETHEFVYKYHLTSRYLEKRTLAWLYEGGFGLEGQVELSLF